MISRIVFISILIFLAGCSGRQSARECVNEATEIPGNSAGVHDLTEGLFHRADSIASVLGDTLLAAQLLMPAIYSEDDAYTLQAVRRYARMGVGGLILLKGTSKAVRAIADTMRRYSPVTPFLAIDAEWGLGMRLTDEPRNASSAEIGATATEQQMFDYGESLARECRRLGINMILGPVADVNDSLGIMGSRCYSSDPRRVADLAVAYAHGLESGGVASVAKHFPGHGSAKGDSHRMKPVIERSLHALDSIDLYPFRRYISHDLPAIMVGHLAVPSIDPDMLPAAVSPVVITDLLRGDLGFKGLVMTDALNMLGAKGYSSADAVAAGADMVLAPPDTREALTQILDGVAAGTIPRSSLRKHARTVIFTKLLHDEIQGNLSETAGKNDWREDTF